MKFQNGLKEIKLENYRRMTVVTQVISQSFLTFSSAVNPCHILSIF